MATTKQRHADLSSLLEALEDEPLGPDDARYFPFHEAPGDPRGDDAVLRIQTCIKAKGSRSSCQLFSGFRGSGKSSEMRRLQANLEAMGYRVLRIEGGKYINLHQPLEVTDLLLSVAAGVAHSLGESGRRADFVTDSFVKRIVHFLQNTNVSPTQLGLDATMEAGGAKFSLAKLVFNLSTNPSFKIQVQEVLRGRLDEFQKQFGVFMMEARDVLGTPEGRCPVIIIDDLEKIRGSGPDQDIVMRRMEQIFANFDEMLNIKDWHSIWTIPPYIQLLNSGIGTAQYDGVEVLPMVRIWDYSSQRTPDVQGIEAMRRCVRKRGEYVKRTEQKRNIIDSLFLNEGSLDSIILASSGRLRDLLALLRSCVLRAFEQKDPNSPLAENMVARIIQAHNENYRRAILTMDIAWLRKVAESRRLQSETEAQVVRAAKLLDTACVLTYRNGHEWFDVNAAIRSMVEGPEG